MSVGGRFEAALAWAGTLAQAAFVSPHHWRAVNELWPWLEPLGIKTALEVGCGEPPYLAARMLREYGVATVTLDAFSACDVPGDVHCLPFEDMSFDLVVARHLLEHTLCPYLALMEMRRVSKGWGLVVIPGLSDKTVNWPDHLYLMPQRAWERAFGLTGWRVARQKEGDFTESYALEQGLWRDKEWCYLLEKGESE